MEETKLRKTLVEYEIQTSEEEFIQSEVSQYVDVKLKGFLDEFECNNKPIQVNFRKLVSWVPYSESHTHHIHQYPAKLLKHIPIFFLNSRILNKNEGGTVLDPFCGSGTVLLESMLNGFNAIGCDANPLARLIAEVKTSPLEPSKLHHYTLSIIQRAKQFRKYDKKNVVNINF